MENSTPNRNAPYDKKLLFIGLLISVACALIPVGLVVLPAFWAYAMCRTRPAIISAFSGAFAACVFVLYLPEIPFALCIVFIAGAGTAILYVLQKKHTGNAFTVTAIAGTSVVALYAAICLPGILSGAGAFAAIEENATLLAAQLRALFMERADLLTAEALELYEAYLDAMPEAVVTAVVPSICLAGALLGLGNVLFFRLFARKHDFGLAPMRPFLLWAIPRELTIGLCIMLVGAAVLNMLELDYAVRVSSTVNVLAGVPLTLQGLSCLDYLLWRKGGNVRLKRILVYIGVGVFFYLMQMGLMLVGCVDQVFRFRERAEGTFPPPAEPM